MELRREADVQKVIVGEEDQQDWSSSLDQADPEPPNMKEDQEDPEPPHIKEDQEDPEPPHMKEELEDPEPPHMKEDLEDPEPPHIKEELEDPEPPHIKEDQEAGFKFSFTGKSEDDEEEAQSSQLHQRQTEQMETEADGEDCGGPEPDRNSDPNEETGDSSEPETDNSDDWKETREHQSGLNKDSRCNDGKKHFSCSECGKRFGTKGTMKEHIRIHTGEKPFSCTVCCKRFSRKGHLTQHMPVHTGEKRFSCSMCNKRFAWCSQITRHICVGRQSSRSHQTHTEENGEADPTASSSTERMYTEADGEDCGGPEPDRNLEPDPDKGTELYSEPDDSVDVEFWKETRKHQSGFTYQRNRMVSVKDGCNSSEKPFGCSDDEPEAEPKTDGVDGAQPPSCLKHRKSMKFSVRDTGSNTDLKPFSTSESQERPEDRLTLLTHKRPPTGKKPFRCSVCNSDCSKGDSLVQHMRLHSARTRFRCQTCGEEFAWRRNLTKHMEVHRKEKLYTCRDCDQRFIWYNTLRNHRCVGRQSSRIHDIQNREAEPPASRSTEHIETEVDGEDCGGPERDPDEEIGDCEPDNSDDKKQTREPQSGLNSLNYEEASSEIPFSCSVCGKIFSHKGNLNRHARTHTGEKPFSCSVCGKDFNVRASLKVHMRCHTGEKPFNCSVCKKSFTQRGSLQTHMGIHTGEKPFNCAVCEKRFLTKAQLKNHTMSHTGQKRFSCSVCHQGFTWYDQLRNHRCDGQPTSRLHPTETEEEPPATSSAEYVEIRTSYMRNNIDLA